ncbi:uncharacterized protein [Lepisosteus oculatus]|uniref:uncharacterized protein isoform X12 n=1 Tax=Lepisosteus oculatus TaxID=7918 RepID=UPI0035F50537
MKIALLVLCFLGTSLAFPIVPGAFSDSHEAKMQQYRWYGAPQQQRQIYQTSLPAHPWLQVLSQKRVAQPSLPQLKQPLLQQPPLKQFFRSQPYLHVPQHPQQQYPFGISPQQWGIPSYGNAPQMMPFFPFGFPQRQAAVQSFEEEDSPRQPRPQAPPQQTPQMFPPFGNVPQMIPQVPVQKSPNGVPTSGNVPQEQPQRPGLQGPPEHSPIPNVPQLPEQPNQNFNPYGNAPEMKPQPRPEFRPPFGSVPETRPQPPRPEFNPYGNVPETRPQPRLEFRPPFGPVPETRPQQPRPEFNPYGSIPESRPQQPRPEFRPSYGSVPETRPQPPHPEFNPYGNVPQARPQLRPEFGPSYGEPQSRPQQPLPPSQDVYPSNGNIPRMRQDPPQQPSPDIVPSWPNSGLARRTPQQPQFIPNVRPSYSNAPQPRTQQPSQNVVPQYVPIPQTKPQPPMHPSPEVNPAIGNTPRQTQYPRQQQPPQLPPFAFQPQAGQQQQDFPKVVYVHLPPMAGMGPNTAAPAESEEAGAPQYGGYVPSFYGYGPFGFGNFGRRAPLSEEINEVNEKESESPGKPEAPAATEAPKAEDLPPTPGGVPTNTEGAGAAASANGTAANGAGNQPAAEGGPNTPGSSPPNPEGAPAGPGGNTPAVGPNLPGRGDSGPNAGPSSPGVAGGFPVPGTNPLYPNLDPFAGVMWPAGVRKVTPSPSAGATQGFAEPGGEDATTPAPMGKGSPALNIPFFPSEGAKRNPSGIRKPPVQVPCNKGPHGPYGNGEQPGFVDPVNPDAEGIILAAADAIHGDSRVPCVVHDSPAQAEENHYYY